LFGGLAIDGGDKRCVLENGIEKLRTGFLQVFEREFLQDTGEGDGVWNAFIFIETQESFEFRLLFSCPAFNVGECGEVGEESE